MDLIDSPFIDPELSSLTSSFSYWSPSDPLPLKNRHYDIVECVRDQWVSYLKILCCYKEISKPPTDHQIRSVAQYFVENQNFDDRGAKGCWNLIPVRTTSDEVVDFVFFPSYIVLSILVIVKRDFPHIARSIEGFNKALHFGFFFAAKREFRGTGYDSDHDLLVAVDILSLGGAFTYALTYPKRCCHFVRAIGRAKERILNNLKRPPSWSSIDAGKAYNAMALLDGEDSDFEVVKQIAYKHWYKRGSTPFSADLAREVSQLIYKQIQDELKRSMLSISDVISEEVVDLTPKYTVFKRHKRTVATTSHLLNVLCHVNDVLRSVESYRVYMSDEWFRCHFNEIIRCMGQEIERELLRLVSDIKIVDDEQGFEILISEINVTDHGNFEFWVRGRTVGSIA